jgi:energy-coupling factor transport system ATP-binding protein
LIVLRFENITYTYPHQPQPALRDFDLRMAPGEVVVCTGPSGSGKSTVIRLANGLIPHCFKGDLQGVARIGGVPSTQARPVDFTHLVGALFQDPETQFFALNVAEELAIALQWRGMKPAAVREEVRRSADFVGIGHLLGQSVLDLSEGEKQKVALAGLLALRPGLLVLDEPTANLDPESVAQLKAVLLRLKEQGVGMLIVDHRLHWFEGLADRAVVLYEGRIAAQGGHDVLCDPKTQARYGLRAVEVEDRRRSLRLHAAGSATVALACQEVSFAYRHGPEVFEKAEFAFGRGGVIALVGANGAGKTTLARLLSGLEKPRRGAVLVRGALVKPRYLPLHVQAVFQNAGHLLRMRTVEAELADALGDVPAGLCKERIKETLQAFRLEKLATRHPQSLSGGEKQRLAVACAVCRKPAALLLDEPTSGLDGGNMQILANNLAEVAEQGAAVVVITHDLELMQAVCTDRVVVGGREMAA